MQKIDAKTASLILIDRLIALILGEEKPEDITCPACNGDGTVTKYHYGWIEEGAYCDNCNGDGFIPIPAGHLWWDNYSTSILSAARLIQDQKIDVGPHLIDGVYYGQWRAVRLAWDGDFYADVLGDSMPEAVARVFVASKLDYEIEVQDELLLEVSSVEGGSKQT